MAKRRTGMHWSEQKWDTCTTCKLTYVRTWRGIPIPCVWCDREAYDKVVANMPPIEPDRQNFGPRRPLKKHSRGFE